MNVLSNNQTFFGGCRIHDPSGKLRPQEQNHCKFSSIIFFDDISNLKNLIVLQANILPLLNHQIIGNRQHL